MLTTDANYSHCVADRRALSARSALGVGLVQLVALVVVWFFVVGPGPYYATAEAIAPFAGVLVFAVLGVAGVQALRTTSRDGVLRVVLMVGTGLTIISFVLFALLCVIVVFGSFP